jgi:hypothetical protein
MTVIADAQPRIAGKMTGEHKFFLTMAIIMALVIVAGFATNLAMGRSSFAVPLIYHFHAFVFFGWVVLYVTQNALVASGSVALHRRLGWLAAVWAPVMVMMGTTMTIYSLSRTGGLPFFDVREFLFGNPLSVVAFAGLVAAAIVNRRRTDWHRRLMFCAMAYLTGPGFGRLLPMPLLIPWSFWVAAFVAPSIFPLIGIVFDFRRNGKVHPAWLWGVGAALTALITADLIAYSAPGTALARAVIAGSPAAKRDLRAHFP